MDGKLSILILSIDINWDKPWMSLAQPLACAHKENTMASMEVAVYRSYLNANSF